MLFSPSGLVARAALLRHQLSLRPGEGGWEGRHDSRDSITNREWMRKKSSKLVG